MFAERFDAIMNIAEVSNSLLARAVHMNPSYIGRLRSGERPLPQKQDYVSDMCSVLARHITKDYQINALQKLTGIDERSMAQLAAYLESWLLAKTERPTAADRLLNVFSSLDTTPKIHFPKETTAEHRQKSDQFFYGNAGKRNALKHFFQMLLQEKQSQTLLLFSDEKMDWLYEDAAFADQWTQLFIQVLAKGNRVKIIHTLSRDINEMIEAVSKWLPIYMTGMVEPYYYPRLRDGIFRRTLFIAPKTAAIASSSVQQNTDEMLNLLLTDSDAVAALSAEFQHYHALCRPLMQIFTEQNMVELNAVYHQLNKNDSPACLCVTAPPLFTMPEGLIRELAAEKAAEDLIELWKKDLAAFQDRIRTQKLTIILPPLDTVNTRQEFICFSENSKTKSQGITYSNAQYLKHIKHLKLFENQFENLKIKFKSDLPDNIIVYVKDHCGVIIIKANPPQMAFVANESNMTNAFWDYLGF